MSRLDGKSAIVTAAATGIGRAVVERFCAEGARVVCVDIDETGVATVATAQADAAVALVGDVADPKTSEAAVALAAERFGGLDIVVSAAAWTEPEGTVEDMSLDDWNRTLAINLTGVFNMSKAAIPALRARGGGSIINVASQLGSVVVKRKPAYVTTKAAVIQLSKSMAVDFAEDNIRVNSLSPGAVETDRLLQRYENMEAAREKLTKFHPIGRLGQAHEIANAALFLASNESSFMTASDMIVDGGYTAI